MTSDARIIFIDHIPVADREALCTTLDACGAWEWLAGQFKELNYESIQILKKEKSPSNELLTRLGMRSIEISTLYLALASLSLKRAMSILDKYVPANFKDLSHCNENKSTSCGSSASLTIDLDKNSTYRALRFERFSSHLSTDLYSYRNCCRSNNFSEPQQTGNMTKSDRYDHKVPIPKAMTARQLQTMHSKGSCQTSGPCTENFAEISYQQIESTTNGWDINKLLSCDGHPSNVYRGVLHNKKVAIKKLEKVPSIQSLRKELRILQSCTHPSVLKLYNFLDGCDRVCIVFPYVGSGSLADYFMKPDKDKPLLWHQRQRIAVETADALFHLKELLSKPVVIKSSTILLSPERRPLLGDVCLPSMISLCARRSYVDYVPTHEPDDTKLPRVNLDSYSYGVVLFELATGQQAHSRSVHLMKEMGEQLGNNIYSMIDQSCGNVNDCESLWMKLIEWGVWCTSFDLTIEMVVRAVSELQKSCGAQS